MNPEILNKEVQKFLRSNENADLASLVLSGSPFKNVSPAELAQQISGLQKARKKLPTWYATDAIYYPPRINLEQTSSETTAQYKTGICKGIIICDLTGGFGVDGYYFTKNFSKLIHCERNPELAEIARYNYTVLDVEGVTVYSGDGIQYLQDNQIKPDLIYVDPSRRTEEKGKVFLLRDCEPNIPDLLPFLFTNTDTILIKTSPLLDISSGLTEINSVAEIHIVAVKNEVKELLWLLRKETIKEDLKLVTVNITDGSAEKNWVPYNEMLHAEASFSEPEKYLYEPNAALMKSGAFNWISNHFNVGKLHPNTHLYTSDELIVFPGRSFKILQVLPYSKKTITRVFKGQKANITTRNFKESVEGIRKKFKIQDGGDRYLFFTTSASEKTVVLDCVKL